MKQMEKVNENANGKANSKDNKSVRHSQASLTVEAALVLPLFLYFMIAFLYFIQILTVQEQVQASITKMGLNLAKTAYLLKDFPDAKELLNLDISIFGEEYDLGLDKLADKLVSDGILKSYANKYLNTDSINKSCIVGGYDGISFYGSSLFEGNEYIDIVVNYRIKIPVKIFILDEISMLQRVKLRCWTGYEVAAAYQTEEEKKEDTVYVTETGSVYHKSDSCSHIKLSIRAVPGIPTGLRNDNGAKYYPCEACCKESQGEYTTYFITSDGTRYHSARSCSKLKRSVKEISISEVGKRTPCKRCYD